jgi:hypothetical protein
MAAEVENGYPNPQRSKAIDAECERRGISLRDEPTLSQEQANAAFMAANARFWELNARISTGQASQDEIQEWERMPLSRSGGVVGQGVARTRLFAADRALNRLDEAWS